jgi:integrase
MGTLVKMIENHYCHVKSIKHAGRVLMGTGGCEAMHVEMDTEDDAGDLKVAQCGVFPIGNPRKATT